MNCRHFIISTSGVTLDAMAHDKPEFSAVNKLLRGRSFGISELAEPLSWRCARHGTPAIIDQCVDAHHKAGLDGIVWNAGWATIQ